MNTLNIENKIVAYGDTTQGSNPRLKFVDWARASLGLQVRAPKSESRYLEVGESWAVFNGTRSTSINNSTDFNLTISTLDPSRYRMTWAGNGADPVFRTARDIAFDGLDITVTANNNGTAKFVVAGGSFTGGSPPVVAGDIVFIPSEATGDGASPFNSLNVGWWQVLSVSASDTIVCARLSGAVFEAASETVTLTADSQFQAYSTSGVQAGDKLSISDGFAAATQKTFTIVAVTPTWVEFASTSPLPEESGIVPTTSGIFFYQHAKVFMHVEVDQEAIVRLNSGHVSSDTSNNVSPIIAGDPDKVGWFQKYGLVWALTVINASGSGMNVNVISCE